MIKSPFKATYQDDLMREGGRADSMEELHRVFSGNRPRDRRPARVAV